jgi:hypothetical protein
MLPNNLNGIIFHIIELVIKWKLASFLRKEKNSSTWRTNGI